VVAGTRWGRDFDPDELATLETRMWKAYYRRQPLRLFVLLIQALRAQARVSWPRALWASLLLTKAAAGFARSTGEYERFAPDIGRGYRALGLPDHVNLEAVARHELRWWVVRREIGLAAGTAAGEAITDLYAALYDVPRDRVAEAGRLRGLAAEVRDRGATDDPDGPTAAGSAYWPEVARLLRDSYRSLRSALDSTDGQAGQASRLREPPTPGPSRDETAHLLVGATVLHRAPAPAAVLAFVDEQERAPATALEPFEGAAGQQFDRRVDDRTDRPLEARVARPAPGKPRPVADEGSAREGIRLDAVDRLD
jgi:hypothetical protein